MATTTTTPSITPATMSPTSGRDLIGTIHHLLGSKLHVTMTDSRVARGNFVCLDRLGNMILDNVIEYRKVAFIPPAVSSNEGAANKEGSDKSQVNERTIYKWDTERSLSQAVIPGDRLAKVEIAKEEWVARIGDISVAELMDSTKSQT